MRKKVNKKIENLKKTQAKKVVPKSKTKPSRFQREKKPVKGGKGEANFKRKNEIENDEEKEPIQKKNRYPFEDDEDAEEIEAKDNDEDEEYPEDEEETEEDDERGNEDEENPFGKEDQNLNKNGGKSPFVLVHPELDDHDPYTNQSKMIDKRAQKQNQSAFYRQTEEIVVDISSSISQKISALLLESIAKRNTK